MGGVDAMELVCVFLVVFCVCVFGVVHVWFSLLLMVCCAFGVVKCVLECSPFQECDQNNLSLLEGCFYLNP